MSEAANRRPEPTEEDPPFFKSWNTWYVIVLSVLAILIGIFYAFTKAYQ